MKTKFFKKATTNILYVLMVLSVLPMFIVSQETIEGWSILTYYFVTLPSLLLSATFFCRFYIIKTVVNPDEEAMGRMLRLFNKKVYWVCLGSLPLYFLSVFVLEDAVDWMVGLLVVVFLSIYSIRPEAIKIKKNLTCRKEASEYYPAIVLLLEIHNHGVLGLREFAESDKKSIYFLCDYKLIYWSDACFGTGSIIYTEKKGRLISEHILSGSKLSLGTLLAILKKHLKAYQEFGKDSSELREFYWFFKEAILLESEGILTTEF